MGKVSIGLRGWRFDEDEVFTEDGEFKPMDDIPTDSRKRLVRLQALVASPCDGCWLIHGDENVHECNESEVVYGEPLGEVVLCADHEPDFLYWFAEEDGRRYKGQQELQDEFHEWFADGGRAPEGYAGVEHVETDPEDIPEPPEPDMEDLNVDMPDEERERIDLRDMETTTGADADEQTADPDAESASAGGESADGDGTDADESAEEPADDLDLGRDYPS
ncbi:hypothetical protein [Halorussus gelatinilyticus]|uniref:hypothetical protein n=1 Tax=Halorussus gelatinilyticus TaxID=2937524 RepID=UPI0034A23DC7